MKIPVLRNFNNYLINDDDKKSPSNYKFIKSLDGHNKKWFVLCESEFLREFFDEIKNNPYSSYITYLNDFIRENYDGKNLPITKVSCFKKESDDYEIEEISSRLANALCVPTAYIKYVPAIPQEEFNKLLDKLVTEGKLKENFYLDKDDYILSIDFIGKNEHFENLDVYTHCKVDEHLCESDSSLRKWFGAFEFETFTNPVTKEVLTTEQKRKLFGEFIPQYFFRAYLTRDWDFNSENVGILYNKESGEYSLAPMFDLEYSFSNCGYVNYERLAEDIIFAYDAYPIETEMFFDSVNRLDLEKFLNDNIKVLEDKSELTTEQAILRETIRSNFLRFKNLLQEFDFLKNLTYEDLDL